MPTCSANHPVSNKPPARVLNGRMLPLIVLSILLASCQSVSSPGSSSATSLPDVAGLNLLSDIPCAAPCWQGLMPGTSSRADVLRVTQALPFIDASSLTEGPVYYYFDSNGGSQRATGSQLSLPCKQSQRTCLSLILVDDVLVEMIFLPDQAITIGQLAAYLGDPDYFRLAPTPGFGPSCDVGLIWLDKSVVAWLHNKPGSTVGPKCADLRQTLRVDAGLEVNQIMYLLPQDSMFADVPEDKRDYAWVGFLD